MFLMNVCVLAPFERLPAVLLSALSMVESRPSILLHLSDTGFTAAVLAVSQHRPVMLLMLVLVLAPQESCRQ